MTKSKNTKRALVSSVISLILCMSMLVGTTFAWFTDSVSSGINQIQAGNLDVELYNALTKDENKKVGATTKLFEEVTLWEPGVVAYENFTVANVGSLDLKYSLGINFANQNTLNDKSLADVLKVGVIDGGVADNSLREDVLKRVTEWKPMKSFGWNGDLLDGEVETAKALVIYWEPTANDNDWNVNNGKVTSDGEALHIELGVNLFATQLESETDSFDSTYDKNAAELVSGFGSAEVTGANAIEVAAVNTAGDKAATFTVPKDAIADNAERIDVNVEKVAPYAEIQVADDQSVATFDVTVEGIKENNTTPITVRLYVGPGKTGVKLYHYDTEVTDAYYNDQTGYVTFTATEFSPFTVVFDTVPAEVETPEVDTDGITEAIVEEASQYVGVALPWGSYGAWSPSNVNQQLEAAYIFTAPHTAETIGNCDYKNWECDFYVSCSGDVAEGEIFLGGNYGSFGWVGFENPVAVAANEEVALLGSVTSNPWTYEDVVRSVAVFTCGVADVNDALVGDTFTVKLCLTNPETGERIAVNTINYTFE